MERCSRRCLLDAYYLVTPGKDRSILRDFVWWAGLYSFTAGDPALQDLFGSPANYPNMR